MATEYLKTQLRQNFPSFVRQWNSVRRKLKLIKKTPMQIFTDYYHNNKWGDQDSLSGPGSKLDYTASVSEALPRLVQRLSCQSILDIPCGDFYWMKTVEIDIKYIGADIVSELIRTNQKQYGSSTRAFMQLDLICDPLPQVDLIFCRDCLVHLSFAHIVQALKNIKASGSQYLLTTTFAQRNKNVNIVTGEWRAINLQYPPFNFPPPLELIDDTVPLPNYYDKHLGLWRVENLPGF